MEHADAAVAKHVGVMLEIEQRPGPKLKSNLPCPPESEENPAARPVDLVDAGRVDRAEIRIRWFFSAWMALMWNCGPITCRTNDVAAGARRLWGNDCH